MKVSRIGVGGREYRAAEPVLGQQAELLRTFGAERRGVAALRQVALGSEQQRLEPRASHAALHLRRGQLAIRREGLRSDPI